MSLFNIIDFTRLNNAYIKKQDDKEKDGNKNDKNKKDDNKKDDKK